MTRASTAGVAARRALQTERRVLVVEYMRLYPSMSTDDLAARLGWDRSTIRRDRAALCKAARAKGDPQRVGEEVYTGAEPEEKP